MIINFYKNFSEDNVTIKKIEKTATAEGKLIEGDVSITDPSFSISYSPELLNSNYVYIPEFKRFYFVKDISILSNKIIMVHLHCDVLSSFWEQIKNNDAYVSRSEQYGCFYLEDTEMPIREDSKIFQRKVYTSPFHGSSLVMTGLNTSRG